jgi:putative transposase
VNRLKGRSSRILRQEFPALRSRLPTLWSRSYFAATVGAVSEQTIRCYIADQKGKYGCLFSTINIASSRTEHRRQG